MTKFFCIVLPLLLIASCSTQVSEPIDRNVDIKVVTETKLETWPSFYKNQDANGLADFLHPDFIFILNDGGRSSYQE